jgi:hypothetical protein
MSIITRLGVSVSVALGLIGFDTRAQKVMVNPKEIEPLINEWNYVNNSHSSNGFQNLYADNILFYTQRLTRTQVIALKQKMFAAKPNFRQRITNEITYIPYTAGVIKCEFVKQAYENSRWKSYPSYLLVSYENSRYWIVGESDSDTDRTLKFTLDIGNPMELETMGDKSAAHIKQRSHIDSAAIYIAKNKTDPIVSAKSFADLSSIYAYLTAPEMVSVRRDYIFLLTGILIAGGLMLFAASGLQYKRGNRLVSAVQKEDEEHDDPMRDALNQSHFEAFVITLFDPLFFRSERMKHRALVGNKLSENIQPDLHMRFDHKEATARVAVQCLYKASSDKQQLTLFSLKQLQFYTHYEEEHEIPVYYVIGVGGTSSDPKELYLIPAKAIQTEVVNKSFLKPFQKSGMFFYNAAAGKLL